jgi:hypothetical protein
MSADINEASERTDIRRLSDLDDWEFYRIIPADKEEVEALTIALRPYTELRQLEYEVWDKGGEEPRYSGTVPWDEQEQRADDKRRMLLYAILERVMCQL